MKIPKRVNNVLDWAEGNIRAITIVTALVIVSVAALWMPALAAFVLGALVAGVAVRWRMARRLTRLRAEVDQLLRENGALRHEKTMLSQGIVTASGQLTQMLPIIPWDYEGAGDADSKNAAAENADSKSAGSDANAENAGSGQGDEDSSGTERLPIIPWEDEASHDDKEDTPLMGVIRRRR